MSKSIWKDPFANQRLVRYLTNQDYKEEKKEEFTTRSRSSLIDPSMIGKKIKIYNGKEYKLVVITEPMVSYKLGDFVFTRKVCAPKKEKKKKNFRTK